MHIANDVPGSARMYAKLKEQALGKVIVSAVTAHELRHMIVRAKASTRHVANLEALVRQFPVEPFDLPAAQAAADVRTQLEDMRKSIGSSTCCLPATRGGSAVLS